LGKRGDGEVAAMNKLRVLDLFSGIGGFSLGLERTGGFETAAFCEYAEFPRKVLAKHWPDVPIYPDIRELTAERLDADGLGRIDILTGGYPCQPFSHAGKRLGAEDDRHLWPEMRRLVETLRPAWVIGENVAGHVSMGLDDVLSDLGALGYACQAFVIPACAVNAPHRRDRVWIVAYAQSVGRGKGREERNVYEENGRPFRVCGPEPSRTGEQPEDLAEVRQGMVAHASDVQRDGGNDNSRELMGREQVSEPRDSGGAQTMATAHSLNAQGFITSDIDAEEWSGSVQGSARPCGDGFGRWATEPAVGRVAHGVPSRVDRLKALGNAVVPQIPEMIGHAILQSMRAA